jgi:hypothetical protein
MLSWLGWVATAVFAVSYLCRDAAMLRRVQAAAAVLWVGYGVALEAPPVIVANLIVAAMALYSSLTGLRQAQVAPRLLDAAHFAFRRRRSGAAAGASRGAARGSRQALSHRRAQGRLSGDVGPLRVNESLPAWASAPLLSAHRSSRRSRTSLSLLPTIPATVATAVAATATATSASFHPRLSEPASASWTAAPVRRRGLAGLPRPDIVQLKQLRHRGRDEPLVLASADLLPGRLEGIDGGAGAEPRRYVLPSHVAASHM